VSARPVGSVFRQGIIEHISIEIDAGMTAGRNGRAWHLLAAVRNAAAGRDDETLLGVIQHDLVGFECLSR
jgi:hypothetical protein